MRRIWIYILLAVIAVGGFAGAWSFLASPHYALYQIGKAVHDREPRLFLAYVDLDHILFSQKDELVKMFMPQRPQDEQDTVSQILGAVMSAMSGQIRQRISRMVADPERDNIPSSWTLVAAANVTRNGNYALVVLSEPSEGRRLRLGMQKRPEVGHWQVVEVNPHDLRKLLEEYLEKS